MRFWLTAPYQVAAPIGDPPPKLLESPDGLDDSADDVDEGVGVLIGRVGVSWVVGQSKRGVSVVVGAEWRVGGGSDWAIESSLALALGVGVGVGVGVGAGPSGEAAVRPNRDQPPATPVHLVPIASPPPTTPVSHKHN